MKCKYCKKEFDTGVTKNFCSWKCLKPHIWWRIYTTLKQIGFLGIISCMLYVILTIDHLILSQGLLRVWGLFISLLMLGFIMWSYNPWAPVPNCFPYTVKKLKQISEKFLIFLLFIIVSNLITVVLFTDVDYKIWFMAMILISGFLLFFTIDWFKGNIINLFRET